MPMMRRQRQPFKPVDVVYTAGGAGLDSQREILSGGRLKEMELMQHCLLHLPLYCSGFRINICDAALTWVVRPW